ncbi:MAG: molybdopterin molybdenumtransferase MoeA [Chloroflexi bacterium]|nr:MAG: molybdopterin molybdenumtransferase MoeA [Chloroflexota bacterium]
MKKFFNVTDLEKVFEFISDFPQVGTEEIPLSRAFGRILSDDIVSDVDLPDFSRSTMDGYAVRGSSTFGASEGNPGYLTVKGSVSMGAIPSFSIGAGEAAKILTGGMLPDGSDSVVMIEHTEAVDNTFIEVYQSVAPGQNIIEKGEDIKKGETILAGGQKLRAQEIGLLAAIGKKNVQVYKKPVIGIISTGDEIVQIEERVAPGQIRDINTHTLSSLIIKTGGIPASYGIVKDDYDLLLKKCLQALDKSDMVMISGGSSVGTRDYTMQALSALPGSSILVHGISISPGKPTILSKSKNIAFWGLPGHVASAMVVFTIIVSVFIEHISGLSPLNKRKTKIPAILTRNISSAQGRTDFIRMQLIEKDGKLWAKPILGKSGLINTMVKADGLVEIEINTEGLNKGTTVSVIPF